MDVLTNVLIYCAHFFLQNENMIVYINILLTLDSQVQT